MGFEDFRPGTRETFGRHRVTRAEVLDFATRFDPTPAHVDDAAAQVSPVFDRLSVSGVHTIAMMTRMLVDHWRQRGLSPVASPGFTVRFVRPVYPDDILDCAIEVGACSASKSRPALGRVHYRIVVRNQEDAVVLELDAVSLFSRRTPLDAG